jgi:uncharacterized membrane protein
MFSHDLIYIAIWWIWFFIFGLVSIPLCFLVFKRFVDLGYGFAKTISLLVITYLAFAGATFHLFPLHSSTLYLILIFYAALNFYIFTKNKKTIISSLSKKIKILAIQEILFTLGLIFWSFVRAHQPDILGLEKLMDFGFINSILRSTHLPPADMWFAGSSINYYWFGHLVVAIATKLSNVPPSVTYNLMLATILGLTLTGAFSISATLVKSLKRKVNLRIAVAAGLISAVLLAFGGNFHTPFFVLKEGTKSYWYPDATRFIGYNPDVNDKTIHEFPQYSFVVSDLHAHLINLPFVLLFIALLANLILENRHPLSLKIGNSQNKSLRKIIYKINFNNLIYLFPLGFVLGVMFMTNAWDFANYSLLTAIAFLIFVVKKKNSLTKKIIVLASVGLIILLTAVITALPFILNFESIAQGIKLVNSRSALWQLSILWGFPAILSLIFVWLLTKLILITLPEIFYVKDIYIASHHRANTMFKLTYQAFVMFYLSSGYIAARSFTILKSKQAKFIFAVFYTALFASILYYPNFAISSYYGHLKNYKGLSGEAWLKDRYPGEYEALLWFRENVKGQPTILEAPGDSYTDFNVVSSYSGLPTISGWFVHEWLWRGDSSFPQKRVTDITQIYTSSDTKITKQLLDKYDVSYVIVGTHERQKYPNLNENKFSNLGEQIFSSTNTKLYKLK